MPTALSPKMTNLKIKSHFSEDVLALLIFILYSMLSRTLSRVFSFSTGTAQKTYGGLKDSDRIFTNVYRDGDPYIKGAVKRVFDWLKVGRLASDQRHIAQRTGLDHLGDQGLWLERTRRSRIPKWLEIFVHAESYKQRKTKLSGH